MGARASREIQIKTLFDQISVLQGETLSRHHRALYERLLLNFASNSRELTLNPTSSLEFLQAIAQYKYPTHENHNNLVQRQ
jgi:type II restriction/modification system DNA methylase subunit YeeA